MPALIEFDQSSASAVRSALGESTVHMTDPSHVLAYVRDSGDPVVVIGPSVDEAVACRVTIDLATHQPATGVIWLRRRLDTATVLRAIRAGASDVVGEDDLTELVAAAARVARNAAMDPRKGSAGNGPRGKLTAVHAAKGGAGKTSIAVNVGAILAREMKQRVCLLDLDLESGDIQILMGLPHTYAITDLVGLGDSLDASSLRAVMVKHESGASVLAAPRRPEESAAITPFMVAQIIDIALGMFDHVIVDCPPYATEHVLTVLDSADFLALICTPDAACVKNTALTLETLNELGFAGQISLMVNHAGDQVGISSDDIAHALAHPVACQIPSSLDVPAATNHGRILSMSYQRHPVANAIRGWSAWLVAASTPAADAETATVPEQQRRSLFRRRKAAQTK